MPLVALFATCLVDQVLPEIGVATVKLLRRAGHEVDFPNAQTCCGQPFFNSGYRAEAVRLAKRTIEIFESYEAVVLPSGSCAAMIRIEYPHLLADEPEWHERAAALAGKTCELTEFLTETKTVPEPPVRALETYSLAVIDSEGERRAMRLPLCAVERFQVTVHDSCHMCRMLGIRAAPRAALETAGAEITEMVEPDRCCGFGGLFSVKMPEVSGAIAAEKLRLARETGAPILITGDPGCLMHMRRFSREGDPVIAHIAVVLEALTR
jgi:L-lactate dehydrogenase complex protein LldE